MTGNVKHVPEMDYLRAFAILAVLAIHVSGLFTNIPEINSLMITNIVIDIFTHFAVPLFLFISGFLLYLKYNRNYSVKEFAKKRFFRIIPPYLIFTVFYLFIWVILLGILTGVYNWPSVSQIIYAFFTGGAWYHLWFFLIIIELYLFYPIIVKIYHFFEDTNREWLFLLLALILQSGWQIFGSYFQPQVMGYELDITNMVFFCRLVYFALRIYVCNHFTEIKEKVEKKSIWMYVLPVIVFTCLGSWLWIRGIDIYGSFYAIRDGTYVLYESLLQPLSYLFTFALLFVISKKIISSKLSGKWLLLIGSYSFGIFLIHPFFLSCISYVLGFIGITSLNGIYYPILFVSVLMCSMIFVWIMQKIPFHKYIIG